MTQPPRMDVTSVTISAPDPRELAAFIEAGAALASYQPQEDVRVMLDPAGHPFCLFFG